MCQLTPDEKEVEEDEEVEENCHRRIDIRYAALRLSDRTASWLHTPCVCLATINGSVCVVESV